MDLCLYKRWCRSKQPGTTVSCLINRARIKHMCQVLVPVPAPCPPFQPPTHTPPLQNALQISVLANSSLVLGTMVAWGGWCHSLRWLPLLSGWHKHVLQHICDTLEKHKGLALAKRASDLHSQLDKGEVCFSHCETVIKNPPVLVQSIIYATQ